MSVKHWVCWRYCMVLFLALCSNNFSVAKPVSDSRVEAVVAALESTDSPGCSVGVFRDGETIHARGYGIADLEQGVPLTRESVFYIASMSKQFTALSAVLASRQGHLALDDDIRIYLPEMPVYDKPITIRHLIYHTSGLRDYLTLLPLTGWGFGDHLPKDFVIELIARQASLNFTPGTRFAYSNSGYFLLAVIIERATGATLREFSTQYIFKPLGMLNTFFFDDYTEVIKGRAQGHARAESGEYVRYKTSFDLVGDGGVFTTVNDLLRYDRNFYANVLEEGSNDLFDVFLAKGSFDDGTTLRSGGGSDSVYGFGLSHGQHRDMYRVAHSGSFRGFRSQYVRFPDERLSTAVLCNDESIDASRLAYRVADALLAVELRSDKAEVELPERVDFVHSPQQLNALSGVYLGRESPLGAVRLVAQDGTLSLKSFFGQFSLLSSGELTFRIDEARVSATARFVLKKQSTTFSFELDSGQSWEFEKLPDYFPSKSEGLALSGRYYCPELDAWHQVYRRDEMFLLRAGYQPPQVLLPLQPMQFSGLGGTLVFERDASGEIDGYAIKILDIGSQYCRRQRG